MEIFAKEIKLRQYKTDGVPYEVDLCFIVQKLVIEVDEEDHVNYDEEKHQIRQNLIENLGVTFIIINPDVEDLNLDVEIVKLYNSINELFVRLAVDLTEKSLKGKFEKELLSYMSIFSKSLKHIRYFINKTLPSIKT